MLNAKLNVKAALTVRSDTHLSGACLPQSAVKKGERRAA